MSERRGKRGQFTIFIIIAVVIVAAALFVLFLQPKIADVFLSEQGATQMLSSQVEPLRDAVASCVAKSSKDFFVKIGESGGYYDAEGLQTIYYAGQAFTAVMFKDSNKVRINNLPSLDLIELQYSNFLAKEGYASIDKCLNNFASFKRSMDVAAGNREIKADIKDDSIIFKVTWPITISKQTIAKKITQTVTQKDAELLIPLGKVWTVADDVVECEVQIGCQFTSTKWDEYSGSHTDLLRYISKGANAVPGDSNQIAWILQTTPYRQNEETYNFKFGIKRE